MPDKMLRCVSEKCTDRGISKDVDYVIRYGLNCTYDKMEINSGYFDSIFTYSYVISRNIKLIDGA